MVVARQNGADVYLRDIGRVFRANKDREIITRVNGGESVEIEIYKEADANIVAVAERVRSALYGLPVQQAYVEELKKKEEEKNKKVEEGEGEKEEAAE